MYIFYRHTPCATGVAQKSAYGLLMISFFSFLRKKYAQKSYSTSEGECFLEGVSVRFSLLALANQARPSPLTILETNILWFLLKNFRKT